MRVVIDRENKIDENSFIFDDTVKTTIFSNENKKTSTTNTQFEVIDFSKNIIPEILDVLYKNQIQSIIIEGGRQTLQSFIDENIWDEARIFVGKQSFGNGTKAPIISRKNNSKTTILSDELIQIRNYD
ncbi:hypothetical protein AAGS39_36760 [Flavobacterium sp. CGRL2]